jgi:CBS domain containing-hemolysin-like protein
VIAQMQRARKNVAIVVDEYGGTAGLLAFEDLVEEIIGDFQDEFDADNPALRLLKRNQLLVRGDIHIEELNQLLGTLFRSDAVDTIGGLAASALGKIPAVGEEVVVEGMRIRVEKMAQNRVAEVIIQLSPEQSTRLEQVLNE